MLEITAARWDAWVYIYLATVLQLRINTQPFIQLHLTPPSPIKNDMYVLLLSRPALLAVSPTSGTVQSIALKALRSGVSKLF